MVMMMTLNLILIPLLLFTFNILTSCIIGAKSDKFSKGYAIFSSFINFVAITSVTYYNGTEIIHVECCSSVNTYCSQTAITFLFCLLLIVIIPLGIGLFAASLTYMSLHIEIWLILALNKCVLIPVSDRIVVYSILCSYLVVCCSILLDIKTGKDFSVRDAATIFIRIFLIIFFFKWFIAEPLSELLSVLPALVLALSCDKVTIGGVWYADSAGNEGGGSSSHNSHSLPGSSSGPNVTTSTSTSSDGTIFVNTTVAVDRTATTVAVDQTATTRSTADLNYTGLTDTHWHATIDKLGDTAEAVHLRKVSENEANGTNRSTRVRLSAAINEAKNPPFTPFSREEIDALWRCLAAKKGTTGRGFHSMTIYSGVDGKSIVESMRNLR